MSARFDNVRVTVMGLGLQGGGVGVAKWFAQQGAQIVVTDLRSKKILSPSIRKLKGLGIRYVLGKHRVQDFRNANLIIKNPGVPKESKYLLAARTAGVPIETDVSLFFRLCPAPIVAITGTKGKSTTASLLHAILKKWKSDTVLAGNIRISPLQFLGRIKKKTSVVLELSSWQLEDMRHLNRSPHIAIITNIMRDHLNRYKSLREYENAKEIIFQHQRQNDFTVLNRDNAKIKKMGTRVPSHRLWFSKQYFPEQNGTFVHGDKIVFRRNGNEHTILEKKDVQLAGRHNLENTLAAVTAAMIMNVPLSTIRSGIKTFRGIEGRLERLKAVRGVEFINDTASTTPDATIAALESIPKKVILIAGGVDKKLDFKPLARILQTHVKRIILLPGSASKKLTSQLPISFKKNLTEANSMEKAVRMAWRNAEEGDTVLLSPGAASFNLFLNEFDRGNAFRSALKKLSP